MSNEIPLSHSYPSIQLIKSSVASEDFLKMANDTIYGTPGRMCYAHANSVEKIRTLKHTSFIEFKRNEKTLGIVALVSHLLTISKRQIPGLYIRYFSMNTPFRSDGQRVKKKNEKQGLLHQVIKDLFDDPNKLTTDFIGKTSVVYAFVESQNDRSLNMVKSMGFQPSRQLVTLLFSRFYPKKKLKVTELLEKQFTQMNQHLKSFYSEYNLVPNFDQDWSNYFTHEIDGEIICGVSLETNTWRIYEMPGFDGFMFRKVLPHIPILNKIFQKDKIDFIGIERLYIKLGYEYLLPDFLETLCFQFGVTKALIGVDNKSQLHDLLKTKGRLGILDRLITPSPGFLFSRTYGITEDEKLSLHQKPFYVSTYDMS